jgi:hypothetical protein
MELGAWGMEWRGMERRTGSLETTFLSFKPRTAVYRERWDIATRIRPFSTVKPTAERSETDLSTAKAAKRDRRRARSTYVVAPTCHVAARTSHVAARTRLVAARTKLVGAPHVMLLAARSMLLRAHVMLPAAPSLLLRAHASWWPPQSLLPRAHCYLSAWKTAPKNRTTATPLLLSPQPGNSSPA